MSLQGKHVLVTGAAGALGTAVAAALAAEAAVIHAPAGRNASGGVDVTDEAAVERLFASLPPLWASVHLVGAFAMKPLVDTRLAEVRALLDVNFTSAFLCTREAARKMAGSGGGRIVNVASHAAETAPALLAAYAASKAAVLALTKSAAAELYASGVRVNAVAPTTIDTAANRAAMPGASRALWASPEAVASAVVWLAAPENDAVSGAVVTVGG